MKSLLQTMAILFVYLILFSSDCKSKGGINKLIIIFIIADDMGYNDLGCYGQKLIKSPNIDRLAEEGICFTQHYAGSTVCASSRAVLMTGLHMGHSYIRGNYNWDTEGNVSIPDESITVAELMREKGYSKGVIGKWGLGGPGSSGGPNNQGFDYSLCYAAMISRMDRDIRKIMMLLEG